MHLTERVDVVVSCAAVGVGIVGDVIDFVLDKNSEITAKMGHRRRMACLFEEFGVNDPRSIGNNLVYPSTMSYGLATDELVSYMLLMHIMRDIPLSMCHHRSVLVLLALLVRVDACKEIHTWRPLSLLAVFRRHSRESKLRLS